MQIAYVGCRTTIERNARGKGLKVFHIDEDNVWNEVQCIFNLENPSYQTIDNKKEYLYSVHGDISSLTSYKIDNKDGTLTYLNELDIGGKNPVFLSIDSSNKFLIVATLQGGSLFSIELKEDGRLGEVVDKLRFPGKNEEDISFAHQCIWDQKKKYLFVPTQARIVGHEALNVIRFNSDNGKFELTDTYKARQYSEPRHLAVHKNNRFLYLINEKGNYMTYLSFDDVNGKVKALQNLPTLPDTYVGEGQASASVLTQDNKILIGSNRIHESLVLYRVDQKTGYMKEIGYESCFGKTPRFITFGKDDNMLYVANEDSDTIVEFLFDEDKERLFFTGNVVETESPVCITFL